jgi:hypothetical protein
MQSRNDLREHLLTDLEAVSDDRTFPERPNKDVLVGREMLSVHELPKKTCSSQKWWRRD